MNRREFFARLLPVAAAVPVVSGEEVAYPL
jgi:hypothetical protein